MASTSTTTSSAPDAKPGEEPALLSESVLSSSSSDDSIVGKSAEELVAEQRKWHEARIRRRLFSEYEKAGRALSDVVRWKLRRAGLSTLGRSSMLCFGRDSFSQSWVHSNRMVGSMDKLTSCRLHATVIVALLL